MESKDSDLSGWRFGLEDDKKLRWTGRSMKTRQRKRTEPERVLKSPGRPHRVEVLWLVFPRGQWGVERVWVLEGGGG